MNLNMRGPLRRSRRDYRTATGQVRHQETHSGLWNGNPDGVPTKGSCKALETIQMPWLLSLHPSPNLWGRGPGICLLQKHQ